MVATPAKKGIKLRPFEVTIPTPDGTAVADRIKIDVPMKWDEDIHDWTLTPEAESLIETTKARHMGLLLPEQLRALRVRLGLTQKAIGDLFQLGAKSWTRWESGAQRPSRSINLLLRSVYNGWITPQQLQNLVGPTAPAKPTAIYRMSEPSTLAVAEPVATTPKPTRKTRARKA